MDAPRRGDQPGGTHADVVGRRLLALLDEQHALLGRLDALSQRQSDLIDRDEEPDRVLAILAERQAVIDRMEAASRSLEPVHTEWMTSASVAGEEVRDAIRRRLESTAALMDLVQARDASDRDRLESRRQALAGELASMDQSRRALGAYGATGSAQPRFRDQEA
jgi:hypothetical protein